MGVIDYRLDSMKLSDPRLIKLIGDPGLTPAGKVMLLVLWSFSKDDRESSPSLMEISKRSGLPTSNIPRLVQKLVESGYIRVGKNGRRNLYRFLK